MPLEGELSPARQRCSWRMRACSSVQGVYGTAHPYTHTQPVCEQKTPQMGLGQSPELAASTGHKQGGEETPLMHHLVSGMATAWHPGVLQVPPEAHSEPLLGADPPAEDMGGWERGPGEPPLLPQRCRSAGCQEQLVFLDPGDYKKAVTYLANPVALRSGCLPSQPNSGPSLPWPDV